MENPSMPRGSIEIVKVGNDPDFYAVTFAMPTAPDVGRGRTRQDGTGRIADLLLGDRELHDLGLSTSFHSAARPD